MQYYVQFNIYYFVHYWNVYDKIEPKRFILDLKDKEAKDINKKILRY